MKKIEITEIVLVAQPSSNQIQSILGEPQKFDSIKETADSENKLNNRKTFKRKIYPVEENEEEYVNGDKIKKFKDELPKNWVVSGEE